VKNSRIICIFVHTASALELCGNQYYLKFIMYILCVSEISKEIIAVLWYIDIPSVWTDFPDFKFQMILKDSIIDKRVG